MNAPDTIIAKLADTFRQDFANFVGEHDKTQELLMDLAAEYTTEKLGGVIAEDSEMDLGMELLMTVHIGSH